MSHNPIENILHYLLNYYPYPEDLTKTRITKLIYLVDWYSALFTGKQATDIDWYFDHYGPYVSDVLDVADEDSSVRVRKTSSAFGGVKYVVEAKNPKQLLNYEISEVEQKIIDKVIEDTKNLTWNKFIDFVYSTDPIRKKEKYNRLDLVDIANDIRNKY